MFLENSRYFKQKVVETKARDGRVVKALALRTLPAVNGQPTVTKADARLDILSQQHYGDPTRFWHIADANTKLEANDLVAVIASVINIPEQ